MDMSQEQKIQKQIDELRAENNRLRAEKSDLEYWADQGQRALALEKETAKYSVLISMNLDPSTALLNDEYKRRCNQIDEMTSIDAIAKIAQSNFGSDYQHAQTTYKQSRRPVMRGANNV